MFFLYSVQKLGTTAICWSILEIICVSLVMWDTTPVLSFHKLDGFFLLSLEENYLSFYGLVLSLADLWFQTMMSISQTLSCFIITWSLIKMHFSRPSIRDSGLIELVWASGICIFNTFPSVSSNFEHALRYLCGPPKILTTAINLWNPRLAVF